MGNFKQEAGTGFNGSHGCGSPIPGSYTTASQVGLSFLYCFPLSYLLCGNDAATKWAKGNAPPHSSRQRRSATTDSRAS